MFSKILIANRGEIACRVIRTAQRLGIATVAVHSEADAGARHVALADEAVLIGPAAVGESYLKGERILQAAKATGAEAIHPGYGFLSENAAFAEACAAAGIAFIGPPAAAIRAMGLKDAAKALMEKAGVPVVPGYHEENQDPAVLARAAAEIGYPVLIKAVAGGGGKGMRRVDDAAGFASALEGAMREAESAFGDSRVLIEKYLTRPRHIEIQVFADSHGRAVHLFERDCSLQRRHQKVVEEAPAPDMPLSMREAMGAAAVRAAEAIGYVGAGTIEFIADVSDGLRDDAFYFMEMNTRLQVEHPVTELITGQDLVEWQLRVADGEPLPLAQSDLAIRGHAIEVRLYAEDPARGFLPQTGTLLRLRLPEDSAHVRVDSGVVEGDAITPFYDPMIAKLIVWDEDRASALRRLAQALGETEIAGLATNLGFLGRVARHPAFAAGELDTGFIGRLEADLLPPTGEPAPTAYALGALYLLLRRKAAARALALTGADPWSPWAAGNGWRLNDEGRGGYRFLTDDSVCDVTVLYRRDGGYRIGVGEHHFEARGTLDDSGSMIAVLDGIRRRAAVTDNAGRLTVTWGGTTESFRVHDPLDVEAEEEAGGALVAPMPGKVISLVASAGAAVEKGMPLLILEAMKMEHTIVAPANGRVAAFHYEAGDQVDEGAVLLDFDIDGED
ncbi:acetyl/propionyl/methylcrotonyl-CoA carboxylase subunit alpha [Oceanibacterium hippocampi]|uniref:Acetyl-/propionyl-coenzyme A carboxylase alpha chain n=1 Tax=Oceanibacterium hippocampi TaxID=745714 RepID=A0A1Y5SHG1_9PROT|nr:acetyl/propionyl/methylcrotonyl-CoA carboxylase subunit alpha [Oceanibacterium hippocampi]SLN40778.1 Acetyl-/propionyl-coenzyme A carboxylase alpha chain [Oceanibacterium hippocampi]